MYKIPLRLVGVAFVAVEESLASALAVTVPGDGTSPSFCFTESGFSEGVGAIAFLLALFASPRLGQLCVSSAKSCEEAHHLKLALAQKEGRGSTLSLSLSLSLSLLCSLINEQ